MKKTYFLTLLTLLFSIATAWAEFNPTAGKPYALQERTSGLYLDILTGVDVSSEDGEQRNVSLSATPCAVYFEAYDEWTWKIKNANNQYVNTQTSFAWNPEIGDIEQNWFIVEEGGYIKIHYWNSYIIGNTTVGTPLFCNNSDTPLQFALIDFVNLTQEYTFYIDANAPEGVSVTYDGNSVSEAQVFNGGFVVGLFVATDIDGYTWEIVVDDENHTITLIYTEVQEVPSEIYATVGEIRNGKYHFTSQKISCPVPCNTLRFTLTDSEASYQNGAKRMSFDSFELFDAQGNKVELKEDYFTGNNNKSYAGLLDGLNAGNNGAGCCCGAWGTSEAEDDWFEITLPNDVDLGGAFSFSFVTENTTMNARAFRINLSYVEIEVIEYVFSIINAPVGETVEVTYDDKAIAHGGVITGEVDAALFEANDIPGYTWSVEVDEENHTVTLTYTEAELVENPDAVVALVNRIGGANTSDNFKFVLDPSINSRQETFILGSEGDKIRIKGSTLSAITTGLGWYLNNIAKVNIAWNSLNEKTVSGAAYVDLTNIELPLPAEERHVSDAKYRYYLNYCTFGYSMTSWTWKRWQQEIDWMALHGINMPLQIVGLEEVWRRFLTLEEEGTRKYGYSDAEAMAFVPGPAYTAWWGMNNLQGWGGTGAGDLINTAYDGTVCNGTGGVQDKAWFDRQLQLATDILACQRELGMQPVLPGFSGMVPRNFTTKTGVATDNNGGEWQSFWRPCIIDPTAERFAEIASDYYACLHAVMGESQYYSMDPFHEGGSISSGKYSEAYLAIYEAMNQATDGSQWVIQQWHWTSSQELSTSAVPAGRLIVLDLFSDGSPAFDKYTGYAPQDAVFCAIPNFGGRSGLMGRLQNVTDNYFKFKGQYASIKGIGTAPEAIEQTPVTYDLIYQLPWMNGIKPDVAKWVADYAVARYGVDNAVVKEAWDLLRQGPLNYGADGIEGPIEDVWAARPNLSANPASKWGKTLNTAGSTYTKARRQMLVDATFKLLSQSEEINANEVFQSNYNYDLVEFGGAAMADYAYDLLLGIAAAKNAAGVNFATDETYIARKNAFLALIEDVDAFKGTNLNFRLGKWTEEARDAADEAATYGATLANADWYEFNNARTLITTWTYKEHGLNDYSYRSWQGLMKDVYLPRWRYYFDNGCAAPSNGTNGYFFFEWNWAHGMEHSVGQTAKSETRLQAGAPGYSYSRNPEGNTVAAAKELLDKYIIPVVVNGDVYYAYRYLDNDISGIVTIPATAGATVDLTAYFGELGGNCSIACDVVGESIADLSQVVIDADAADGAHSATITLEDDTKLAFYISINPAYYGVYTIDYKNGGADAAVFIGYNEDLDNAKNVGYKLLATGTYTANAIGDSYFTITPAGAGFNISAQGKYLKAPTLNDWSHVMFSDNQGDAGVYIFEETSLNSGIFKIRDPNDEDKIKYINAYPNFVFGNDKASKENLSTFTFTPAETYAVTIPNSGYATLCLPFNVVLPDGICAYDINTVTNNDEAVLVGIAAPGNILKKGTPVILNGEPGGYALTVTMNSANARGSMANSLLRGTYVKQTVTPGGKYQLNANRDVLSPIASNVDITNGCWVEWGGSAESLTFTILDYIAVGEWKLRFEETEGGLTLTEHTQVGGSELVIPSTHIVGGGEKAVTALADNFLEGNTTITSIVLPETITEVGDFSGCTSLESITFTSNPIINGDIAEGVELRLLLNDSKGVDFNSTNENTYHQVSYVRNLPDGVYGSIILPFVPDASSLENYSFFVLSSSTSESLIFAEVRNPQPNTPYLYTKKAAGPAADITAGMITIANPGTTTSRGSWVSVGCYANGTVTVDNAAHYYGISSADNQFYRVTGSIRTKPYRAYFKNTDTSSPAAPKLTLRLADGNTTEIDASSVDREYGTIVYDLQGRPVANPSKGLYIVDGKKVVIK